MLGTLYQFTAGPTDVSHLCGHIDRLTFATETECEGVNYLQINHVRFHEV
jgi:hypothetical protein